MLRLDQVTIFDDKTRLPSQRRPTRDCSTAFMHNYDFVILAMQVRSDASGTPHTIPTYHPVPLTPHQLNFAAASACQRRPAQASNSRLPFFAWQELVLARPWEFEDNFWLYEHVRTLLRPMLCVLLVRSYVV